MVFKKLGLNLLNILAAALFFTQMSQAQLVAPQTRFSDNVNISFGFGTSSFHGDFDSEFMQINGETDSKGFPFPVDGFNLNVRATKPLPFIQNPNFRINALVGLDLVHFKSVSASVPLANGIPVTPTNIINTGFGPSIGLTFEYLVSNTFSIEPFIHASFMFNDPKTDGFLRNGNAGLTVLNPNGGSAPFSLDDDAIQTRAPDESISTVIPSVTFGVRFSNTFIGNFRWFAEYKYQQFLDDFFDNTSSGRPDGKGEDDNDAFTHLTVGLQFPLAKGKRSTLETDKKRIRIDRKKIAKIERIQNIANLITTDEDLQELQRILSDKILLYDTPGIRFNELASKVMERRIPLADSEILSEMLQVPGGSYIIGLTAVDELGIQVQGRKRITINPFLVDKYEVTNQQYRSFLYAMNALPRPVPLNPSDPQGINYGSQIEWQELLERAGLSDYANHVNPPELNGPEDLMPADTQWTKYGLDDIIPWETYFYDPYYNDYPIVCVNYYQAKLFAAWSGKRLLTESEWEFSARSSVSGRVFPWDGLDVQTKTGKFRANFKQGRGVYDEDGYAIMGPVNAYLPNDFGLYNTAGNVSEWVLDSWNPSYVVLQNVGTSNFVSPSYTNDQEPRKIHRGGSWQSTKFYIGVGVRNFQDKNTGTPFVGFRCAKSVTRTY